MKLESTSVKVIEVNSSQVKNLFDKACREKAFIPYKTDPELTAEWMLKSLSKMKNCRFFASVNARRKKIGFITVWEHQDGVLAIGPMYVAPNHRNMGIGKRQISWVLDWARNNKIKKVIIKTWGNNSASRKIIESLGFKFLKEIPDARVDGDSTVIYQFNLTPRL